jgi:hypothetical protein
MPNILIAMLLLLTSASALAQPSRQASSATCRTFPETGKTVCGRFLEYWDNNGGLAQQGFPISGEFEERSDINGKTYTVQYFERAVFEHHPENQPPYDVLLSMLGRLELEANYPNGAPQIPPQMNPGPSITFPETGRTISGAFLQYWQEHGGLAQQGFPISSPMPEVVTPNSEPLLVQYFERARFELHPETGDVPSVLLSRLGAERFESHYPNGEPVAGDVWSTLRARPLNLPYVLPTVPCPANKAGTVNPNVGLVLGDGPVYPIGFDANGVYNFNSASQDSGWYILKVLWTVDPARYSGPILVRGHQLDGPNEVRFGLGANPAVELQLDPKSSTVGAASDPNNWPNWPTNMRLRAPGCYAFQVDGTNFTTVLTFRADNQ